MRFGREIFKQCVDNAVTMLRTRNPQGTADPFHIIPQIPSRCPMALVNVPRLGDVEHHQVGRIYWRLYHLYIPNIWVMWRETSGHLPTPSCEAFSTGDTLWQRQDWDLGHLYLAPPGVEMSVWWSSGLLMGKSLWGFMGFPTLADHTIYTTLFFFNSSPWKMTHLNRWFTYYKWWFSMANC